MTLFSEKSRSRPSALVVALVAGLAGAEIPPIRATDAADAKLDREFAQTIRPLLNRYCTSCHGGAAPAAQFDLRAYSTMAYVIEDLPHWTRVIERLTVQEMPPPVAPQPTADDRRRLIDWVSAVRANEARRSAGDPGPVLVRRLSNAEYNNTIRDLTGVDLRPTREFPVDPANTAGFDNSGESLSMSPTLLDKYLKAAREVGDRLVLMPDGFEFSPHPMLVETDREKYAIKRIVDFYEQQPTDYAEYFRAVWRFKHRSALGQPGATLTDVAAAAKVSAKYLSQVWQILEESPAAASREVGPIAKLQALWRALPPPEAHREELLRAKCVEMRDFVVRIRKVTAMEFVAPTVKGLSATSQPLINWKYRQFNSHRRDFDRDALRVEGDAPPVVSEIPNSPELRESAFGAAALMKKARAGAPDLVVPAGERARYEASFARFSSVFPDAFYIRERGRFFPDDSMDKGRLLSAGYHNVMGYWRDDTPLVELILDDDGRRELDRLWDEFDFIADHTARTWVQYFFNQSGEVAGAGRESGSVRPSDKDVVAPSVVFALRDAYVAKAEASGNPVAVEAMRYHFQWENDTLRRVERMRLEAEPSHLAALVRFATRAYRRPLAPAERDDIMAYYRSLRGENGLTHEEAMRDSITMVLMSPRFLYRIDVSDAAPGNGTAAPASTSGPVPVQPLSGYALASRLSYFLWSSMPDEELLARAEAGDLQRPDALIAQARRMLKDGRARGLALDFAGNWLDFRRFEEHNAVDRDRFPSFTNELREAMFQEPVRFLEDVIRGDRSVLDLLYANHTFVNPVLAKRYGIPDVEGDPSAWVRVDDAQRYGRGGLPAMAVFLTQYSPGLRTSPVKRGYWVVRRLLGETIPPPPATVPELPTDEAKSDLPLREMLAKHRETPSCASCHARFDSLGLVFEGYGPIGERRAQDLAGRPVDTGAVFPGGSRGAGLEGLREYIRAHRQGDFIENLSRKLFAYALGRSLQLSDEPAIEVMKARLTAGRYRFASLVEAIVGTPQFLNRRRPNSSRTER
jgi:hypothetical protein